MIASFNVTTAEGVQHGSTSPVSSVETERRFLDRHGNPLGITTLFTGESPRTEALYWLMWRSLHPLAAISDDVAFMSWLTTLTGYDFAEEPEDGSSTTG
jgi:hypothetical protein